MNLINGSVSLSVNEVMPTLGVASANYRILNLAAGVCQLDRRTDVSDEDGLDLVNAVIGYGSLLLGLSNWALAETGVTLPDQNMLGVVRIQLGIPHLTWLTIWYSGNVPWWFAGAVRCKFSLVVKVPNSQYIVEMDADHQDNNEGYIINKEVSNQMDLSILTSATQYERRTRASRLSCFKILTPNPTNRDVGANRIAR